MDGDDLEGLFNDEGLQDQLNEQITEHLAIPASLPHPPGLAERLDELRLTGCCQCVRLPSICNSAECNRKETSLVALRMPRLHHDRCAQRCRRDSPVPDARWHVALQSARGSILSAAGVQHLPDARVGARIVESVRGRAHDHRRGRPGGSVPGILRPEPPRHPPGGEP